MSSYLSGLAKSVKDGASDLARGVQGKETGAVESVEVAFDSESLGMTVSDYGGEGMISEVEADGEASRLGVCLNDRVVKVNGIETKTYKDVVEAIRGYPSRPLSMSFERREKRTSDKSAEGSGLVNFRLDEEIDKAKRILELMLASPKSGPAPGVIEGAKGLAFLRVTKVGFGLSGRFGSGLVVARLVEGGWSAPSAIGTVGVSMGFQMGAQIADFLIVLNTDAAVKAFSGGGQVTVGGQVGAVAGPVGVGREASVAAQPKAAAPIFTYSISKGLFAGVSLEGSVINERNAVNERHYASPEIRAAQILKGDVKPMPACADLHAALTEMDAKAVASDLADTAQKAGDKVAETTEDVADAVPSSSDVASTVTDTAGEARDKVAETAKDVADSGPSLSKVASNVTEAAGEAGDHFAETAEDAAAEAPTPSNVASNLSETAEKAGDQFAETADDAISAAPSFSKLASNVTETAEKAKDQAAETAEDVADATKF